MSNISNNNVSAENEDFTLYAEYKAGVYIWKIIPPILILLGTVGNILSVFVLTRKSILKSTTALYLTVLTLSDLVVLYSGLLRQWLIYLYEKDVRHVSPVVCKIHTWLVYSSLDFSAWILIAVTIERVIAAWLPHRAKTTCTKKSAAALMISIGIFVLGLNSHFIYGMVFKETRDTLENEKAVKKCSEIDQNYSDFIKHTWPWIDLCAFCVIPFTVIVTGNSLILFKVVQSQKKVKSRLPPSVTTGNGHDKHSSMTAILFTLNIVFLLSTSPISIYNIGEAHWLKNANKLQMAQLDLCWAIANMLMYTNNSINFLLYCLSGTKFRQEVIRIFCKNRNSRNGNIDHNPSINIRTRTDVDSKCIHVSPNCITLLQVGAEETTRSKSNSPIVTIKQSEGKSTSDCSGNTLHSSAALNINTGTKH